MSRIDELTAELCPNGVDFRTLASVGRWYGGGTPSKGKVEYWENGTIPWVSPKDMGRRVVDSAIDSITEAAVHGSATKLVPPGSVAMVVRSSILDHTFPTALVPVAVALNQDMKAIVPFGGVLPGYLAHLLNSRGQDILRVARKTGGSVASIETSKLFNFRIPVPPLEVQREIVRVLDQFTQLETELAAELKAELEARRQQYFYYRDQLLSFRETGGVRWIPIGEVGTIFRGKRFTKDDYVVEGGIGVIHYGEIYTEYGVSASRVKSRVRSEMGPSLRYATKGDVVLTDVGETVVDVGKAVAWLGEEDVAIHDHCYVIRSDVDATYLAYVMQTSAFTREKGKHIARTKVKTLLLNGLKRIVVPVPPLEEQRRIVAILDKFDALVNDLSVGLPAELNARRKQYEYYRDKLLTFREAA
ncbi:MAG: restriction endonuclease subunit S [Micropruina sp.]|uniref:restriction endonuclease subunit S n=1 Tax=Micropruina sp. TaxID=2737536 RepID=UPI0039E59D8B